MMSGVGPRHLQVEATECGIACVAAAASLLGHDISVAEVRQRHQTSSRGSTMSDLSRLATSLGMSARGVRCEPQELVHLASPAILHWNMGHFVVLEQVKRGGITIFDPSSGRRSVSWREVGDSFTGVALELARTPDFRKRKTRSPLDLMSLVRWTALLRGGLSQILLLSLVLQVYVLASPFFLRLAIDEAALKGDLGLLGILALGFGLFALINAGAEVMRGVALTRTSSIVGWDMTTRLYRHLIRLPLPWFQARRLSDAFTRFESIEPVRNLIASGLVASIIDGFLAIGTLVMAFVFSPPLAGIVLLSVIVSIVLRAASVPTSMRLSSEMLAASIAEQGKRIETLRVIQTIKVMSGEADRERDWASHYATVVEKTQKSGQFGVYMGGAFSLIDALTTIVIIYIGVRLILSGEFTVGALYAFLAYKTQFVARSTGLFEQYINWRLLDVHSERLADIVLTPTEPGVDRIEPGAPAIVGGLEAAGIAFRFSQSDSFVFQGISLAVRPGEFVAITGPSGVGKSTLLKVLCGLYAPANGEVRLDGSSLVSWSPRTVRSNLGVVLQEDELLSGTISDNVAFFGDSIDHEQMWDALRLACIDEEVRAMPMRAETFVGDMGAALSGGQKQRILLARALYRRPRILVLDEATSHLDLARERAINDILRGMDITRLVVAHRPETIALADRVLVMTKSGLFAPQPVHAAQVA